MFAIIVAVARGRPRAAIGQRMRAHTVAFDVWFGCHSELWLSRLNDAFGENGDTRGDGVDDTRRQHMSQQQAMGRCGPSEITYRNMKFLITDKPTDATLSAYIDDLKRRRVSDVVRVCESTYSSARLQSAGITCHDWAFDDGTPPPQSVIKNWLSLVQRRFEDEPDACVAVHCVAGLGRAPVLVAIALIEAGMKFEEAVERIREQRRGAINAKQLQYLSQYKSQRRLQSAHNKRFCLLT